MSSEGRAVKQAKSGAENENSVEKNATLKDKVSDNVANITEKIQQGADSGKGFLSDQAGKVNVLAHQALDKANEFRHQAVDAIGNSSEYIKNFDFQETRESVKTAVKEKPEVVLLSVAFLGLAVGYLLGKRRY